MNVLIMAGQLILGLSILVLVHELGHFLAARAFGMRVDKFYLFFDAWGVKLFKFKYKDCEYGIGWLPLGGYVKISGMIDESMDKSYLSSEPQPWEFRAKPAWQRLIVMLGGIIMNILAGIAIFWVLVFHYGETKTPVQNVKYGVMPGVIGERMGIRKGDFIEKINGKPVKYLEEVISSKLFMSSGQYITVMRDGKEVYVSIPDDALDQISDLGIGEFLSVRAKFSVDSVMPNSGASKAGLLKGDKILAVNGVSISFFDEMQEQLRQFKNKSIELKVQRANKDLVLRAQVNTDGKLGFIPDLVLPQPVTIKYSMGEAFPLGAVKAWSVLADNVNGLKKIVTGQIKATKALNSPIGIAKVYGASFDWVKFWSITGLISMALALMNLLPIPALDGGHVVFLVIEIIRGKPVSDKVLENAQMVGMLLLFALMIFTVGNDLVKIFF